MGDTGWHCVCGVTLGDSGWVTLILCVTVGGPGWVTTGDTGWVTPGDTRCVSVTLGEWHKVILAVQVTLGGDTE